MYVRSSIRVSDAPLRALGRAWVSEVVGSEYLCVCVCIGRLDIGSMCMFDVCVCMMYVCVCMIDGLAGGA